VAIGCDYGTATTSVTALSYYRSMGVVSRVILSLQLSWLLVGFVVWSLPVYCARHCSTGSSLISWILVGWWLLIEFVIGAATLITVAYLAGRWFRLKSS
jgi:hypothetical protein